MISSIGGSTAYGALYGSSATSSANSPASLAQTEEQLFASIDTSGDGSISQSELSSFLNQTAAAGGGSTNQSAAASALFTQMSGGSNGISLQQFEANAGDLVTALKTQLATSGAPSTAASGLLAKLSQGAQALASSSAAGIASSSGSAASSNTRSTGGHHHHHGGGSLVSQFLQQYQATGATATPAVSTVSASA